MSEPLVSVIMSCYNCERTVETSLLSIINQTYSNLEIIVCNDCSTDNTLNIIETIAKSDSRIIIINNSENKKLTKNLNTMIDLSKGSYIARMDADDISLPTRIEKEVAFLENNPDYVMVGCNVFKINDSNKKIGQSFFPITNDDIQIVKTVRAPFCHPSVLIRSNILKELKYNEMYSLAQDYDLWLRLLENNKGYNLKEKLFLYRTESLHNESKHHKQLLNQVNAAHQLGYEPFSFSPRKIKSFTARVPFYVDIYKNYKLISVEFLYFVIVKIYYLIFSK